MYKALPILILKIILLLVFYLIFGVNIKGANIANFFFFFPFFMENLFVINYTLISWCNPSINRISIYLKKMRFEHMPIELTKTLNLPFNQNFILIFLYIS